MYLKTNKITAYKIVILLCLPIIVLFPGLTGDFIWDDYTLLVDNPLIKASDGIFQFFFSSKAHDYFPLFSASFWIEWRLFGLNPVGYHIITLLFHITNAFLIWLILHRLSIPGSWLAALLFAIHPVNVESAVWISEQKNTLSMFFFLLTIFYYIKFLENNKTRTLVISVFLFLLASLSKTAVVMTPVFLLFLTWWKKGSFSIKDGFKISPFFLLSFVFGLITLWFQHERVIDIDIVRDDSFLSRFIIAGFAFWFYIGKAVFPHDLLFVYPFFKADIASLYSYIPMTLVLVLLLAVLFLKGKYMHHIRLTIWYIFLMIFPVLGFLNIYFMRYSHVSDHWQYFSIIGIITVICSVGTQIINRIKIPYSGIVISSIIVMTFSVYSNRQSRIYKNMEVLWQDTITRNPTAWMAHYNLGNICKDRKDFKKALDLYHATIALKPDHYSALNNIGFIYFQNKNLDSAAFYFSQSVKVQPMYYRSHQNLGLCYYEMVRYAESLNEFIQVKKLKPDLKDIDNVINQVFTIGISFYQNRIQANMKSIDDYINLATLYELSGNKDRAKEYFNEALKNEPGNEAVRQKLSKLLSVVDFQDIKNYRR
jgi:Tfp pilus assembly protein PilF